MNEKLSSLMDGELDDDAVLQCLKTMDADPALKATWNEYHLIGDALRGSALLTTDIRAKLEPQLQQEPTVLAPRAKVVPLQRRWTRYAMAASFALAGVVGWYGWQANAPVQPGLQAQAVPTPGGAQLAANVVPNQESYLQAHRDMMAGDGLARVNLETPAQAPQKAVH